MATQYRLEYGGSGSASQVRLFEVTEYNDAVAKFAKMVTYLDAHPEMDAAFASIRRLPDEIYPEGADVVAWTKCPPYNEGEVVEEDFATVA